LWSHGSHLQHGQLKKTTIGPTRLEQTLLDHIDRNNNVQPCNYSSTGARSSGKQNNVFLVVSSRVGIHVGDPHIDPIKDEFTTLVLHDKPMVLNNKWTTFQDDNSGLHFAKVDMNKFDGSDPLVWVARMEHCFSFQGLIDDL
jgi:hypothetical protein